MITHSACFAGPGREGNDGPAIEEYEVFELANRTRGGRHEAITKGGEISK
jgi:hypothetical protein